MMIDADPKKFCFIDCETRATVPGQAGDLRETGVYPYKKHAYPVMWTYCIGEGSVGITASEDFSPISWDDMPAEIHDFYERALKGKAWFVAWNMNFDRNLWNCSLATFPELPVEATLDAMVQAASSSLPGDLENASRKCGFDGKKSAGKTLINLFAPADGALPRDYPEQWEDYKAYGIQDTDQLRKVFFATRRLPLEEWQDYWVSERINDRGVGVDIEFAERANLVGKANIKRINEDLSRITNGEITAVTQIQRITPWVYNMLDESQAREIMVKKWSEDDESDELIPAKLGLDKPRIEQLLAYFEAKGELTQIEENVFKVLEHRYYGGSTSPAKFGKILTMHDNQVLKGQYTFNGAAQTGRFSSRGVQIHNLIRKTLGDQEGEFIETINDLEI